MRVMVRRGMAIYDFRFSILCHLQLVRPKRGANDDDLKFYFDMRAAGMFASR